MFTAQPVSELDVIETSSNVFNEVENISNNDKFSILPAQFEQWDPEYVNTS